MTAALIVVDVQRGFDDPSRPPRDNPACEANVRALIDAAAVRGDAIVLVRHDSTEPSSTLHPDAPGNAFKPILDGVRADLVLPKRVHSAFHGEVDLHAWLTARGIHDLIVCGIQTNRCCETTTRVAGDLGYDVRFVLDATHTFDEPAYGAAGPEDETGPRPEVLGAVLPAALLSRVTAANLDGHFARVVTTAEVVAG